MRGEKWVAPTADNPVDIALLKTLDLSTVKLKCHCCGKDAFRRNPGDSKTPLLPPTPGAGLFICTGCPQTVLKSGKPKRARGSDGYDPYRLVWCVKCLESIPDDFESAFKDRDGVGPWEQRRSDCWHCSSSSGPQCNPSECPKVPVETRRADKRKAEALSAEATPLPSKKQRTVPLAPSLTDAEDVVNITELAKSVYARGLFSCHPEAFVFFVPDFELKAGSYKLVEPKVTKRAKFPVVVGMCRPGKTDTDGVLRCSTRTCKGRCIHVPVLQLVLELAKAKKCKPPITPEGQFPEDHPPLELRNGLAGYWAVLHRNERWVLCKQAEGEGVGDGAGEGEGERAGEGEGAGKWVCQECPSLAK
jgi:hypothetical protein